MPTLKPTVVVGILTSDTKKKTEPALMSKNHRC